jgi:hypothetical protein
MYRNYIAIYIAQILKSEKIQAFKNVGICAMKVTISQRNCITYINLVRTTLLMI